MLNPRVGQGRRIFDNIMTPRVFEHFPEKWTSGFPQKMRPEKEARAHPSAFSTQRKRNAL
jgi:hypothetical protein